MDAATAQVDFVVHILEVSFSSRDHLPTYSSEKVFGKDKATLQLNLAVDGSSLKATATIIHPGIQDRVVLLADGIYRYKTTSFIDLEDTVGWDAETHLDLHGVLMVDPSRDVAKPRHLKVSFTVNARFKCYKDAGMSSRSHMSTLTC